MKITVRKRNLAGEVTWSYDGQVLAQDGLCVRLEALFNRDDVPFMDVVLKRGDRFVEEFYFDRWYNIFRIHDREDGQVKGWYCNVGRPAVWDEPGVISYVDLALDLWVSADGRQAVLDEDEFAALPLDEPTRALARQGLQELQALFLNNRDPLAG